MRSKKLIQLYVTNLCNSHCKTCTIWKNKQREELSIEAITKVVEACPDADFVIGGGEAMLHSDIDVILYYLRERGTNYTLLSNCIQNERLKELIKKYNVPNVTISLDGIEHDFIRGTKRNRVKIEEFIGWARNNSINFKLSYTYSRYNEDLFKIDMRWIKSLGVDKVYFCLAQEMDLLKTNESGNRFVARHFSTILRYEDMLYEKDYNAIKAIVNKYHIPRKKCDSQNSVFTVYSDGNVVRCQSYKSDDILGNINVEDFKSIADRIKCIDCEYDFKCNLLCQRRYD